MLQTKGQCAKRARHGGRVHHRQHMQAKTLGQVGCAGLTVKQAHDPFHNDQVGLLRSSMQACAAVHLARHPQVHLVHRRATGQAVPVRVQKIRPALEHPHLAPLARVQARQRGGDGGLALPGGGRGDQECGDPS